MYISRSVASAATHLHFPPKVLNLLHNSLVNLLLFNIHYNNSSSGLSTDPNILHQSVMPSAVLSSLLLHTSTNHSPSSEPAKTLPWNSVKCLFQVDECIIQPPTLSSKLLLNLSYYENGIFCTLSYLTSNCISIFTCSLIFSSTRSNT